jgi:hypothetical protein
MLLYKGLVVWALKQPATDFSVLGLKTWMEVIMKLEAGFGVIAKLALRRSKVMKCSWLSDA